MSTCQAHRRIFLAGLTHYDFDVPAASGTIHFGPDPVTLP